MGGIGRTGGQRTGPRIVCEECGQGWEKHPATAVPCPQCRAGVGTPCKRPSGHDLIGGIPHVARERKAVDEGLMELCPEGPTARSKRDVGDPAKGEEAA